MFDTMTLTKVLGGLCGTFLIYLLGGWFAEIVYHGAGGHGHEEYAYVIEAEEDDGGDGAEEEGPTFEEVFASADPAAGEGLFRACQACHAVEDGNNGVGPHLYGVVGREVGSVASYGNYSGALSEAADVWTPENLNGFLENPSGYASGTSMGYSGMRRLEDRANLIAWLDTVGG